MNYRQEIRQEIKHAVENIVDLAFSLQEKSLSSDQMAQFRARFQSQAVRDAIGGAEASLKGFLAELLNEVQTKNPARFLRWKTIQNTMFVQSPAYIKEELAYLKRSPDWETALRPGLLEDAVGAPAACLYYPKSSGNLIHHTYHLKRFSDWSGQAPSFRRVIFEFGGGYGSFARVWRRHGFKGKYFIYDFAPFNEIQAHYLTELGFRTYVNAEVAEDPEGTYLYSDLSLLEKVMGREPSKSLAIATWSLSESPLSVREKVEPILRRFEQFLFAFQHEFDQVDNLAYFASFAGETIAIPHLPGNSYCFGRGNEHQSK